jgi:death-on-curing protein
LAEFGGRPGIRDLGLIQSAIGRPYTGYYRSMAQKASALLESIACNHGFVDGNKRTAVHMLGILLSNSGYALRFSDKQTMNLEIENLVLALVNHDLHVRDVTGWLNARLERVS